jgi:hypothetical protein
VYEQPRWHRESVIPIAAGLAWLWSATSFGVVGFLFSVIPGCLLLTSGLSALLYPGDLRISQYAALGGAVGVPLAIPVIFVAGFGTWALLTGLSLASFVAAGVLSIRQEPHHEGVPTPVPTLRLGAEVGLDEALLGTMSSTHVLARGDDLEEIRRDVHAARELYQERGWLEKPAAFHATPPPLEKPELRPRGIPGLDFEHLSFESGYEPHPDEPGRERWLSARANRTAHAWVLRHPGGPRPWLVCVHGYQMGLPLIDLHAFEAARLHHRRGLNLLLPVLPLHGPRKKGRRSGDHFIAGDVMSTLHAEAQAMWDLRRLVGWVREQGGGEPESAPIGVYGLSLGGYNAALFASLEDELACVVAGIPLTDFSRAVWRHGPPLHLRYFEKRGVVHEEVAEVLRVVSPLAMEPRVPRERRYLFGAPADRLVPADQVRDLWAHWDEPRIVWYPGGHITFRLHAPVRALVDDALREGLGV